MSHTTNHQHTTYSTVNSVPDDIKIKTIPLLNDLLAEFIELALLTKQAHWNMRGHNFISVHEMLDTFNASLLDYADKIAERTVQLGGIALGRISDISEHQSFPPYPQDISLVEDHLNKLLPCYGMVANHVREIIDNGLSDETTLNILTDASENLDKYIWFMEAQLFREK